MKWVFSQLWRSERWKLGTRRMLSMWLMLDGMVPQGMDPVGYGVYIDWFITLSILSLFFVFYAARMFGFTVSLAESQCHRDFVQLPMIPDILYIILLTLICRDCRWMILKKFLNFRHQLVTWMKLGTPILWLSLHYGPP